jgi:hypothetical protein
VQRLNKLTATQARKLFLIRAVDSILSPVTTLRQCLLKKPEFQTLVQQKLMLLSFLQRWVLATINIHVS